MVPQHRTRTSQLGGRLVRTGLEPHGRRFYVVSRAFQRATHLHVLLLCIVGFLLPGSGQQVLSQATASEPDLRAFQRASPSHLRLHLMLSKFSMSGGLHTQRTRPVEPERQKARRLLRGVRGENER